MAPSKDKTRQGAPKSTNPKADATVAIGSQLMRIVERQTSWVTAEISAWKAALAIAKDKEKPRRWMLQGLYDTAMADGHLTAAVEKRQMRVTGQGFRIVDDKGMEDVALTELFRKSWFLEFMEIALSTITHGPCLVVIKPPRRRGELPGFEMLPREHYVPEKKAVIEDLSSDDRLIVLDQPQHEPWCIHLGSPRQLGLLWKAIPYVTFKNASSTAWAEYADLFGQPIRKATVPPNMTAEQLRQIDQQLEQMGRSAYIRLPNGVDFALTSATGRSGIEVFKERGEYCNNEMSKLVEGQTMTSDQGSSKSQGEVHQDTADLYTERDSVWLCGMVNEQLLPKLAFHGFRTEGRRMVRAKEEKVDFEKQLSADKWLEERFDIDHKFFAEKYGAPIKGPKMPVPAPAPPGRVPTAARGLLAGIGHAYSASCAHCRAIGGYVAADPGLETLRTIVERIAREIHGGTLPEGVIPPELLLETGNMYQTALGEAFGGAPAWDSPDQAALEFLKADAWQFAGARTDTELGLMRELLMDAEGKRRNWSDFRQEVLSLNQEYFEPWLVTEYNHAQVSAVATSQWLQVTADKDVFPNLRYETVGDERVREAHKALDGITRPVDDAFWDTAYPPNGWRCRCDVAQEDSGAALTPPATATDASTLAVKDPNFRRNVGKSLAAFPPRHPYYEGRPTARDFSSHGLPKSAAMPRAKFATVSPEGLAKWFEALPEAGPGARQAPVAGRSMSIARSVIDGLKAANQVQAAAPVIEAATPAETWVERSDDTVLVHLLWFTEGKATKAVVVVGRESTVLADLSLLDHGHADLSRKGTLTQRK